MKNLTNFAKLLGALAVAVAVATSVPAAPSTPADGTRVVADAGWQSAVPRAESADDAGWQ